MQRVGGDRFDFERQDFGTAGFGVDRTDVVVDACVVEQTGVLIDLVKFLYFRWRDL